MNRKVAHYNLLERLGEGALGEVFRARDTKFGRTVALKVVSSSALEGDNRERFLEDARAAAALSHPNIATLFDVGVCDEGHYLAYEFSTGHTLRHEIGIGALSPRRAVELAVQIADALADGHARGVLHTDLRADTVIVTQKGSAKVLEFGIGRWTRGGATRVTAAAAVDTLGVAAVPIVSYMSPEQALGSAVDARTDIFSLGVILHEMLTGRTAFAGATPAQTLVSVIGASLPAPSSIKSDVPPEVDAIVARATSKEIDKRQQSAAALSAELRSIGAVLDVRSGDNAPGELLPLDDERGTGGWWAAGVVTVVVIAAAAWWFR